MREMPYFLTNDIWYEKRYDENGDTVYELTDAAPPEAVKSFEQFNAPVEFYGENGNSLISDGWEVDR